MAAPVQHRRIQTFSKVALFAGIVMAGTGGTLSSAASAGYALPGVRYVNDGSRSPRTKSQLKIISQALETTNAAIARALGVSRQSLYNWLNGSTPSTHIQNKLDRLLTAAEILGAQQFPIRPALMQPLESGMSFWQLVEAGEKPDNLARMVIDAHTKRTDQRALIAERIAIRRTKGIMRDYEHDDFG